MLKKALFAFVFILLVTSTLALTLNILPVRAIGAVYIRADGSIDPLSAPISTVDNVTYTLSNNITNDAGNAAIVVEKNNTVVDGSGFNVELRGTSGYYGIYFDGTSNVTIRNTNIVGFICGILLSHSNHNSILGNNITGNGEIGIGLSYSSYNSISGNNITGGTGPGISMEASSYNNVFGNDITNYHYGFYLVDSSYYNSISENGITSNDYCGVLLYPDSDYTSIFGNNITNNHIGIQIEESSHNSVFGNNMTASDLIGILLEYSNYNAILGNNITDNMVGVELSDSSGSSFFHDNLVDNTIQVSISNSPYFCINSWNDGYPSGGNYWSDYNGTDLYYSPYQNITGSDGIGDTPYVIDSNNTDSYPIMTPYQIPHDIAVTEASSFKTVVGYRYRLNMSVAIENRGGYPEILNITIYANTTIVASQNVTLLLGNTTIVTLAWNTFGLAYGNYTVSAYVEPLPDETDTANNNFTCLIPVHVGVPGDVSGSTFGVYDGVTNMKDIAFLVSLFDTRPSSSNWKSNADVNNDGVCNMQDIAIAVHNFNQHE